MSHGAPPPLQHRQLRVMRCCSALLCLAHHCELAVPAVTVMQVKNGARMAGTLGDSQLYSKMEEASELIKRDIIFAASLYVT